MNKRINSLQIIVALCLSLGITGCSSIKSCEDYQAAKVNFAEGNYKKSFRFLLPLAAECQPRAQYAIGYMYYYGYGVPRDEEAGFYWIKAAAKQCYQPAIDALALIAAERNNQLGCLVSGQPVADPPPMVPIVQPLIQPHPCVKADPLPPPPVAEVVPIKVLPPVMHHKCGAYALQLMGNYDLNSLKKAQQKLGLEHVTMIGLTEHNHRDWYVLLYGKYQSASDATMALTEAPKKIAEMHPWARPMDKLEILSG